MSTDWNEKKSHFSGQTLSWDAKDDFQRLLTIVQNDVVDALNTTLEYGYVLEFATNQQTFTNKSPPFLGGGYEIVKIHIDYEDSKIV